MHGVVNFFSGNGEKGYAIPNEAKGTQGLMGALILRAIVGPDLLSTVAVGALLGQTIALMFTYTKRLIVCMMLGALAPFIVAIDFIRKLV